jgi:hypothetical protein
MSGEPLRWPLSEDEELLWQGRPAPRCYLFKHWLQALLGTLLFLASSFWLLLAWQLWRNQDYSPWLLVPPLLLVVVCFGLGPGWLLLRRWRWESIFYALTSARLLILSGRVGAVDAYPLTELKTFQRRHYGDRLASIRLNFGAKGVLVLECLEHPELIVELLDRKTGIALEVSEKAGGNL